MTLDDLELVFLTLQKKDIESNLENLVVSNLGTNGGKELKKYRDSLLKEKAKIYSRLRELANDHNR